MGYGRHSVSSLAVEDQFVPSNHLEDLVAEWYEFNGYFVRRNVPVGKRPKGGYECELDIVGFNPTAKRLVHIEPSLDADSWKKREEEKALGSKLHYTLCLIQN